MESGGWICKGAWDVLHPKGLKIHMESNRLYYVKLIGF